MSEKHHDPHSRQAPVHDSDEAKPGLDSLAPEDREWRPTPANRPRGRADGAG